MTHDILEAVDRQGFGLRVVFVWQGDRYAHCLVLVDGQQVLPLLASREGTDRELWPASPPWQQRTVEQRDRGKQVALLVGMSGSSHWSLSVEAEGGDPPEPAASWAGCRPPQLQFDVACRVRERPLQLGSQYRLLSNLPPPTSTAAGLLFCWGQRQWLLQAEPAGDCPPARLQITHDALTLLPAQQPPALPATIRWKYRIGLVSP